MARYRKLFLSILVSLFAIVAFVSSTYAWFAITTTNRLDTLDMTVISSTKFELSVDGKYYSSKLPNEELRKVIGDNIMLSDVTSPNGQIFYDKYNSTNNAIKNVDYVSFDLWVRTASRSEKYLYLVENVTNQFNYEVLENYDIDGTYVFSRGINWRNECAFDNGKEELVAPNTRFIYYASDAIRVSTVEQELPADFIAEDYSNPLLRTKIFDLSENETRGYGATIGALSYFNAKTGTNLKAPTSIPDTVYHLSEFINPYEAVNEDSLVSQFYKANDGLFYTKIQVNIWLEGWDADCFDSILRDRIAIQLRFRGANPTR